MKAVSLTIQKLWPVIKFLAEKTDKQTNGQTDRQELYTPNLSMLWHINVRCTNDMTETLLKAGKASFNSLS